MRWDIFCKVIDNHGDLGVCWRLAVQLARDGDAARLWVDDGSALAWMAPSGQPGVQVVDWSNAGAVRAAVDAPPPDVLVEGFGCDPEPALVARFAASTGPRPWINLEYLSAEPAVERLHGLPSPVFRGPGAGLTKRFFYPGFTDATGGLLREPDLTARQAAFDRAAWLSANGIGWQGERLVSLFCYEPAALPGLLAQWADGPGPTRVLVAAGRPAHAVCAALPDGPRGSLRIDFLPHLTQAAFDEMLWCCDLNCVRGEDSLVRALWAGRPMVWQIYPQDDEAHHDKLEAFLGAIAAPPSLRHFHAGWNGISNAVAAPDATTLAEWQAAADAARDRLRSAPDLLTRLRAFIALHAAVM